MVRDPAPMRRDPLTLFPQCAGALFESLAAIDVCGAGRVSQRWTHVTRVVVRGRADRGEGPPALGLLVKARDARSFARRLSQSFPDMQRD